MACYTINIKKTNVDVDDALERQKSNITKYVEPIMVSFVSFAIQKVKK